MQRWDEGADFAFWTGQPRYTDVCAECYRDRDNAEPSEPDGEDLFRNYQAETRDALCAARKLK